MNNSNEVVDQNIQQNGKINEEDYYYNIRDSLVEEELDAQNKNILIKKEQTQQNIVQNNKRQEQGQQNVEIKLEMDEQKQRQAILDIKKQADRFCLSKNYLQAIAYYNQALQYLHYEKKPDQKNIIVDKALVVNIFNNISKCYLDLKNTNESLKYATVASQIDPNNPKSILRQAKAYEMCEDLENAQFSYNKLLQHYNDKPAEKSNIQKSIARIKQKQKLKDSKLKKKMTGYVSANSQPQTITINKNIKNNSNNYNQNLTTQKKTKIIRKQTFLNRSTITWGFVGSILFSGVIPFIHRQNMRLPDPLSRFAQFFGELAYENQLLSTFGFFAIFYLIKSIWNYFTAPRIQENQIYELQVIQSNNSIKFFIIASYV